MNKPPVLGVYGGRFDPFHIAHLQVCKAARDFLPIDELLIIPSGQPVHKEAVASWQDRLAMTRVALADLRHCSVAELEPPGSQSYFHATLKRLPEHAGAVVVILGSDAFARITTWSRWRDLLGSVNWAVIARKPTGTWLPEEEEARTLAVQNQVETAAELAVGSGKFWVWQLDVPELAACDLRRLIAVSDDSWRCKVPTAVAEFIVEKGLYRS